MMSTPILRDLSDSTISSTLAVSATPSAAVGSSSRISFLAQWVARAIATPCRCPPERSRIVAWAEGIQAAIYAFKEITSPYWLNERRLHDHKLALIGEKVSRAAAEVHRPD